MGTFAFNLQGSLFDLILHATALFRIATTYNDPFIMGVL
jgi:hypothetical protein